MKYIILKLLLLTFISNNAMKKERLLAILNNDIRAARIVYIAKYGTNLFPIEETIPAHKGIILYTYSPVWIKNRNQKKYISIVPTRLLF